MEMMSWLEIQMGGRAEVLRQYAAHKISEMPEKTIGEAIEQADSEGWGEALRASPLSVILTRPPKKRHRALGADYCQKRVLSALVEAGQAIPRRELEEILKKKMSPTQVGKALRGLVTRGLVCKLGPDRGLNVLWKPIGGDFHARSAQRLKDAYGSEVATSA